LKKLIKIVITGGIGSGKSFIATIFKSLGIPVYEADLLAKQLMQSNAELKSAIIQKFGNDSYAPGGEVNKEYLASMLFKSKTSLEEMSKLVHQTVYNDFQDWSLKQDAPYVAMEAAIVFESGGYKNFDRTILVTAPIDLRISRLKDRGMNPNEIQERINSQWTDAQKRELCDIEIHNDESSPILPRIMKIHQDLLLLQTKF
jgi:dephospho-CoA kinase